MKKLFALTTILALIFAGCGDGDGTTNPNNNPTNGTYKIGDKGPGGGTVFFAEGGQYKECSGELGSYNFNDATTTARNHNGGGFTNWHLPDQGELQLIYQNLHQKGLGGFSNTYYWSSTEGGYGHMYLSFSSGTLSGYNGEAYNIYRVRAVRSFAGRSGDETGGTTLKINNQSFTEITDIIWNNVSFANNQYENSIKIGTNVTNTVESGAGYIFFKRKSNPITARTRDLIIVEQNEQIEFTFTDNTVIVEVNNPGNNGTLGSVQSTVVWFDDAEGDYLPYTQRRNTTYSTNSARYGQKSIFLSSNAELTFIISLTKSAKLSFWHRTTAGSSYPSYLKINDVEIKRWVGSNEWSFFEHSLNAGNTTIHFSSVSNLYLDDLLIYYTE